jgi:hypothetical protein
MTYTVLIDDNYHFMDKSERVKGGEFESMEQAVEKCRNIVDEYLLTALKPGMTSDELYRRWVQFGEDPFIPGGDFSASTYARERSGVVASGGK